MQWSGGGISRTKRLLYTTSPDCWGQEERSLFWRKEGPAFWLNVVEEAFGWCWFSTITCELFPSLGLLLLIVLLLLFTFLSHCCFLNPWFSLLVPLQPPSGAEGRRMGRKGSKYVTHSLDSLSGITELGSTFSKPRDISSSSDFH